jgi:hypothetical protein
MVSEFCSLTTLASSFVAIKNRPFVYVTLVISPAIGERLTCTSKGDRKMLTTVGDCALPASAFSTLVTRPSAGDTTIESSAGATRSGSRKK